MTELTDLNLNSTYRFITIAATWIHFKTSSWQDVTTRHIPSDVRVRETPSKQTSNDVIQKSTTNHPTPTASPEEQSPCVYHSHHRTTGIRAEERGARFVLHTTTTATLVHTSAVCWWTSPQL